MSLHDMDLLNAPGLNFRQDLNVALKALASTSNSSVDPTQTIANGGVGVAFPFQFWVDTSGTFPVLKIRDSANANWISLGRVDQAAFGQVTYQVGTTVAAPIAYQQWVDTSVTPAVLRIRNGANTAWILIGDVTQANLGLLPLGGGTLTGFLSSSNTDYWKIPVGTTVQRPGTAVNGMIRYNTTLSIFEGFKANAWSTIGGGGGGGGSLEWVEGDNAPTAALDAQFNRVFNFAQGLGQVLYTSIKVPQSYTPGSPVNLWLPFYSPDTTGTAQLQITSTLIRPGTTPIGAAANQRTTTNTAVTLTAASVPFLVQFDIASSTGQINGVSLQAGDLITLALTRVLTDTGVSDLSVLGFAAELTFS